jgi:hypothetical protein
VPDSFSRRFGYKPAPDIGLIYEDAPQTLRIGFWNLLEDLIKMDNLPNAYSLYDPYTTQLRIARSDKHDREKSVLKMIQDCYWYQFYDLCELTFTLMKDAYEYDGYGNETLYKKARECRYDYTVKLNKILSEECIGWQLRKGQLQRVSSEHMDKAVIRPACAVLKSQRLAGPDLQFGKALNFFNRRPKPDIENCIKEAVGAMEAVAKILTNRPKETLGKILPGLVQDGLVKKPLNRIMESVYGFRGDQPGVGHGQYKPSDLDVAEAEFVLHICASAILFLGKKFDIKAKPEIEKDDVPF